MQASVNSLLECLCDVMLCMGDQLKASFVEEISYLAITAVLHKFW